MSNVPSLRAMLAVLPGLAMTMLHSTALDIPRADVIDAIDSDHYRIQWITGAYVLGTAAGMCLTRFIGTLLGLRLTFLLGTTCFTTFGVACAAMTTVVAMTPLRFLQGFGNGLLICAAMVILWRAYPTRRSRAMAIYGLGVYLPSLAGAAVGGLLTTWQSWHWIFLINVPLGMITGALAWCLLPPDRSPHSAQVSFDLIGFGWLMAMVATTNVVLDIGQYWGWFHSPNFVPWFVACVVSLAGFVAWGVFAKKPLINLRPLAIRQFGLGIGIKVLFSINLYVLVALLSGYMISLRGYQWWQGSLVFLPGLLMMFITAVAGEIWGTDRTRKPRMFAGMLTMAVATWQLGWVDVYTARQWQAAWVAVWGAGAGLVSGPALLTAFEGLTTEQTLRTTGIYNILRALPAVLIGTTLATILTRSTDFHFDRLRQTIAYNRPIATEAFQQPRSRFVQHGSPQTVATRQTHATLGKWIHANAHGFAYQEVFRLLALVPGAGLVLIVFVRVPKSVPNAASGIAENNESSRTRSGAP